MKKNDEIKLFETYKVKKLIVIRKFNKNIKSCQQN